MHGRIRIVFLALMLLVVGVVEADCPPVLIGHTTTYYHLISCHAVGCVPQQSVVGQCTLSCDGAYSCWGQNSCGGLTRCRTEYFDCGSCTLPPD